jgi:hypothetical protein
MNRKCFSILNCNIRSLSANFDALVNLISELYFPFSVIGMSETKIKVDRDLITNVDIPGYNFISQPSLSNAGGVGLFLRDNLQFKIRSDLSSTTGDFESLWLEIMNNRERKMLCGVIYRHPSSNINNFINYMNGVIERMRNFR